MSRRSQSHDEGEGAVLDIVWPDQLPRPVHTKKEALHFWIYKVIFDASVALFTGCRFWINVFIGLKESEFSWTDYAKVVFKLRDDDEDATLVGDKLREEYTTNFCPLNLEGFSPAEAKN